MAAPRRHGRISVTGFAAVVTGEFLNKRCRFSGGYGPMPDHRFVPNDRKISLGMLALREEAPLRIDRGLISTDDPPNFRLRVADRNRRGGDDTNNQILRRE